MKTRSENTYLSFLREILVEEHTQVVVKYGQFILLATNTKITAYTLVALK